MVSELERSQMRTSIILFLSQSNNNNGFTLDDYILVLSDVLNDLKVTKYLGCAWDGLKEANRK